MPTDNKVVVSIDKGSILQALKRVSPMTSEVSDLVVLSFNDGYVTISADNAMFGKSASETVACNCDGEIKIGFKGSDLAEMIKNIDDDNIIISLSTPKSGALITAASTYSQDEYISMLAPSLIGQNG
jgi:DNA polymerase-3 subunit beta